MVLDASALVEILLQTPGAAGLSEEILLSHRNLHSPHLVDVEVTQVFRRLCAREELSGTRASEALQDLRDLPLIRYPHELLLDRAWELRENLTIYDGVYVALAELLEVPLLTRDLRIAKAPGNRADVRLIPS